MTRKKSTAGFLAVVAVGLTLASAAIAQKGPCQRVSHGGNGYTVCEVDLRKQAVRLYWKRPDGTPYTYLRALPQSLEAAGAKLMFATNAGMFDPAYKPVGLYVEQGRELVHANTKSGFGNFHMKPNGVFFGSGGKWRVMTADAFYGQVGDRPDFGTQSGPMLVVDGKLHPEITDDGPSKAIRNGVGVDGAGRAHFVISEGPVSFGKLARYFRDVVKAPNALYLDGSVSALWDPAADRMDARAPIRPMIVVEDRAPQ